MPKFKNIFIASLVLVLSGCNLLGLTEEPKEETVDRSGYPYVLEKQGYLREAEYEEGAVYTHYLETEAEKFIIGVKSKSLNLNNSLDEEVIISGKVDLAEDDKTEVLYAEEVKVVEPIVDIDFTDPALDFSFTYPSSLDSNIRSGGVKFYTKEKNLFGYVLQEEPTATTLAENVQTVELDGRRISEGEIEINNIKGILRVESIDDARVSTVFILGNKNFYILRYFSPSDLDADEGEEIFDNIVESFSATDLGDVSGEGEFCGGVLDVECPDSLVCLLDSDYKDAGGTCVTRNIIEESTQTIQAMCNSSRGYLKKSAICDTEEGEDMTCAVLPTCECSGSRRWDEILGCVPEDDSTETDTTTDDSDSDEDTDSDEEDEEEDTEITAEIPEVEVITNSDWDDFMSGPDVQGEMRRMSTTTNHFGLWYPKDWYFMGTGRSYAFSPSEIALGENTVVTVNLVDTCTETTGTYCANFDTRAFEVVAEPGFEETASAMAKSIILEE